MNGWEKAPSGPTPIYVGKPRKDGKQLVTFCYGFKRIRKLKTYDEVVALLNNPEYKLKMGG